jgi:hypothetical protein
MVTILGLGFTGKRLAGRLAMGGSDVFAAVRGVERFPEMASLGIHLSEWNLERPETMRLPKHARIAILIPPLAEPDKAALRKTILALEPVRIVYVSSTGVYGDRIDVDENTRVAAMLDPGLDERGRSRLEDESWIAAGPWSALVLRAAAIYGPGRGVHAAVKEGRIPRGTGAGVVSRIHVDDLAALIEAGIESNLEGAWPVADQMPCSTDEIVQWCAEFLGINHDGVEPPGTRAIGGRSVNGESIRELLGIELKYPSWRTGIPASLEEEAKRENGIMPPGSGRQ